ncbi:segregation/condensation protein A [Candidatus Parcubacteria bacterium]|nr:segregation/condensation protein A [Patescibacteria group bacterium]MCG2694134.1 segregation/condensation protein A [Candidatus Parcubacteria bacterium]
MYNIKLEQFEGPLDLLLQLIEKEDLDINQISLAKIADEYIDYVEHQDHIPAGELADFLLIASKLLYIKSKSLLPYLVWDEADEDATSLEEQLKLYKEFVEASQKIDSLIKNGRYLFSRERAVLPVGFYPPKKLKASELRRIFMEILNRIEPLIKKGKEIKQQVVSIRQKIDDLKRMIGKKAKLGFREFVGKAKNKTEVVVSFLALLELIKQKIINVSQEELFKEIEISKK